MKELPKELPKIKFPQETFQSKSLSLELTKFNLDKAA